MRIVKLFLIVLCGIFLINCAEKGSVLHDAKGNPIRVAELRGKWVIVNYWAAWCDNCIKEIPELNHFYQNNQDKNIVLLGVNYDRLPMADLQAAMNKTHIAFPVVLEDPTETWSLDKIDVLPVTFVIDPNGNVVKRILGANTEKSLLATIQQLQKKFVS